MNWFLIIQSLKQLENSYSEEYSTIIGNCKNVFYLQSSDPEMQRYVSELAGKTSISYNIDGEWLLPVEQLKKLRKTWDYKEAIFIRDNIVYKVTLPDLDSYPFAKEYKDLPSVDLCTNHLPDVTAYTPQRLSAEVEEGVICVPFTYEKSKTNKMSRREKPNDVYTRKSLKDDIAKMQQQLEMLSSGGSKK